MHISDNLQNKGLEDCSASCKSLLYNLNVLLTVADGNVKHNVGWSASVSINADSRYLLLLDIIRV
jgi:hypothetical protein